MARKQEVSQENFKKLLNWLSPDLETAGRKYEAIRTRLIKVFTLRGCQTAEELADETIDRVTAKISAITESYAGDPALYFYGVGRNILLEEFKRQKPESLDPTVAQPETEEKELLPQHECLKKCLQSLPEESRRLILDYYRYSKEKNMDRRKFLADQNGTSANKLRVQIHRIKSALKNCVGQCLEGKNE